MIKWTGFSQVRFDVAWLLLWAVVSSAWCLTAAQELSATFDEPDYLEAGLDRWRTGSYSQLMRMGTMPIPVETATLPIYLWEQWRGQPFDAKHDLNTILPVARAANLVHWWILLIGAMMVGRLAGGPWAGRLAVALIACEPSFLAHATLATTDISITGFLLIFIYAFIRGRDSGWWLRIGLPGLCYGIALSSKASAFAFVPLTMMAIETARWWRHRAVSPQSEFGTNESLEQENLSNQPTLRRFISDATQICFLGFGLMMFYIGSDWMPEESFEKWAHSLPEEAGFRDGWIWIADNLRIFRNGGEAVVRQIRHNIQGHGVYILGNTAPRALWYYFPLLITIKLTISLLLLPLALLFVRPRAALSWISFLALVMLLFTLNCRVQIGIRLIFPAVSICIIAISAGLVRGYMLSESKCKKFALVSVAFLATSWGAYSSWAAWPNGLSYINEMWGDIDNAHEVVSESNLDWGQGVAELARWQEEIDIGPMKVCYFGRKHVLNGLPMKMDYLHVFPFPTVDHVRKHFGEHVVAISKTFLYGQPLTPGHALSAEFFRSLTPIGQTTTFMIFDLRPKNPVRSSPLSRRKRGVRGLGMHQNLSFSSLAWYSA